MLSVMKSAFVNCCAEWMVVRNCIWRMWALLAMAEFGQSWFHCDKNVRTFQNYDFEHHIWELLAVDLATETVHGLCLNGVSVWTQALVALDADRFWRMKESGVVSVFHGL